MTRAGEGGAVRAAIDTLVERLFPGATVLGVRVLGPDDAGDRGASEKGLGYGVPVRIDVEVPSGERRSLVLHTETPNEYGHDRRSDRLGDLVLALDTAGRIPRHVQVIDGGVVGTQGALTSLAGTGEPWLVTAWAEGTPYAEDLRRVARDGVCQPGDVARAEALASYLAALHATKLDSPVAWRRAVRDLVGHGEGIFGLVDGYPAGVAGAPADRLRRLEHLALDWRWRLRDRSDRLARTHGDFHPFNVLFDASGELVLLDASRGCAGDPADDVACMAVNYPFFALGAPGSWARGFAPLWHAFLGTYLARTGDTDVLATAPPFVAWRTLVLASPRWYPGLAPTARERLLGLAERAMTEGRLDPAWGDEVAG